MLKPGIDADGVARTESDHFLKCPGCGEWFDMRDLGEVIEHVHDAEIEIIEGPGTAPAASESALGVRISARVDDRDGLTDLFRSACDDAPPT